LNRAVVSTARLLANVTVPGPLSLLQVVVRDSVGLPSSATVPLSVASAVIATVRSGPAETIGATFAGGGVVGARCLTMTDICGLSPVDGVGWIEKSYDDPHHGPADHQVHPIHTSRLLAICANILSAVANPRAFFGVANSP